MWSVLLDTVARAAIARNGVTALSGVDGRWAKAGAYADYRRRAKGTEDGCAPRFRLLDRTSFSSAEVFMQRFGSWITATLEVEDAVAKFWNVNLPIGICCTEYFSRYLIPKIGKSLVLAIDEADCISECDFSSRFLRNVARLAQQARRGGLMERISILSLWSLLSLTILFGIQTNLPLTSAR